MENEVNYEMLIEDMYKIYLYCIDANNVKIFQNINNKYTTTDRIMLASFIFIQYVQSKNLNLKDAIKIIEKALIYNLVNCSTGNFELNIKDEKQTKIYNEVKKVVSTEKLEYLNRTLRKLKLKTENIENKEMTNLFEISEKLSEIFIFLDLYLNGNELVYDHIVEKINQFQLSKNNDKEILVVLNAILNVLDNKRKVLQILRENHIYNLVSVVMNLRNVNRYSQLHLIIPENVLFHTYINTVMSSVLSNYLKENGEDFDKHEVVLKELFHDFGEYSGNEVISYMKIYSLEFHNLYEQVEKLDEDSLISLIGMNLFEIVRSYKVGFSGYISEILDKITGIMKTLIEQKMYHNFTFLKVFTSNEYKRFEKFYNYERIETSKNKYFYTNLLKLHYIYIVERFLENENLMNIYFNKDEIEDLKQSIEIEKRRLTL